MSVPNFDPEPLAPSTTPSAVVMLVTPNLASTWLEKNPHNRAIRPRAVESYAADMREGRWRLTGEAIKFDVNGNIIDGQHRLWAIVMADTPVFMFVVRGLASEVQTVIDTGLKRTAADAVGLEGHPYAAILSAAVRLAHGYEHGLLRSASQLFIPHVTHSQMFDFIEKNPRISDSAAVSSTVRHTIPANPSVLGFVHFELAKIDAGEADTFMRDLAEGRSNGGGDPRGTLLRKLHSMRSRKLRHLSIQQAHLMFRTWNAIQNHEQLASLPVTDGQAFCQPR